MASNKVKVTLLSKFVLAKGNFCIKSDIKVK